MARHAFLTTALMQPMRSTFLRHSRLGFGGLVRRRLEADESRPWVTPYLTDRGVRRDVTTFAKGWDPDELVDSARWLETFDKPVLLLKAPGDPFFKYDLAKRLLATFPDATLVEFRGARTFVSLDQPERLSEEMVRWLAHAPTRDASVAPVAQEPNRARFPDFSPRSGGYESFYVKAAAPDRSRAVWIRYTIHQRAHGSPRGSMGVTLNEAGAAGPLASKVTAATGPEVAADDVLHIGEGTFGPGVAARRGTVGWPRRVVGGEQARVPPSRCGTCLASGCTPLGCRRTHCCRPCPGRE